MARQTCLRLRLCLVLAVPAWLGAHGAIAAPVPSSPTVVVNVGATSASAPAAGSLLVAVDDLAGGELKDPNLLSAPTDIDAATAPGHVSFGKPVALAPVRSQRRWLIPFSVRDVPAGTTQTRYFTFKVGAADWALPYQIATPASVPVSWSIKPPPAANRALGFGDGIPINVAVNGTTSITGVSLMPLDLVEQVSHRPLSNVQWFLCHTRSACKQNEVSSLNGGPNSLWIMPADDAAVPPGRYEGTITIASIDKPAGESVGLTLNFSSLRDKIYGVLAILAGMAVGLYATMILRKRVERDQLLMGPAVLRDAVMQLKVTLRADPLAMTPNIDTRLDALEDALSTQKLEVVGLPSSVPVPWPTSRDAFKKYVDEQTAAFNTLRLLVDAGVVRLLAARHEDEAVNGPLDADGVASFNEAMHEIDGLAFGDGLIDASTIPEGTAAMIQAFKDAVAKSRAAGKVRAAFVRGAAPRRNVAPPATPKQLRVRITEGSVLAWLILGVVTATTGTYVLVLSNLGFGTCLDFVGCFLWGAGLPAGAALAGATTGTVSTALNITR